MTIRPRAVRSLRDARERLRDLAAARQSQTQLACDRAQGALADEHRHLEDLLDEAPALLEAARSIHDLVQVADSTGEMELAIVEAEALCARESEAHAIASAALGARTRELRSIEKLAERLERERAAAEQRADQRTTDELAARRR